MYTDCSSTAEAVETNVLVHEMVSIGPSRPDAPAPDTPSRALTTFQGDALADGDAASVTNSEGREGDGQGEPAVDSSLLQSRLDALQSLVDSLQQELVVAATYEAQVPSPFLVLRESTLLSSLLMPCLLIASYLGWRLLPITLLSFAALSILFPSSWWYGWIPLLLSLSLSISVLHIARAKSMEPFRRRMFVYGLAFSMWCDYRIVKRQVESLDEQEAEVVWSLHHRRYFCVCVYPALHPHVTVSSQECRPDVPRHASTARLLDQARPVLVYTPGFDA